MPGRRWVQAALVVIEVVVVAATLWCAQGPTIQPAGSRGRGLDVEFLVIAAWWASPSLSLFAHRSCAATLVSGLALLVASAVGLGSIYTSERSTVGIGFLAIPLLRWLLAIGLAVGAWAIARITVPREIDRSG